MQQISGVWVENLYFYLLCGKELMTALIVGSETACRVSSAILAPLEKYGFYMPPILTSFGATAAACKLLDLSPKQIVDALSFNLTQTTCSSELTNAPTTIVRSVREAFAAKNGVVRSTCDGIGMGIGFTLALTLLGAVRELLGTGKVFNATLFPENYGALVFVLAPGAFIALGYLIAIFNKIKKA